MGPPLKNYRGLKISEEGLSSGEIQSDEVSRKSLVETLSIGHSCACSLEKAYTRGTAYQGWMAGTNTAQMCRWLPEMQQMFPSHGV